MGLLSNVEYFLKCGEKQCRLTFGRIYATVPNKSQPKRRWVHEEYKPANYGKNRTFQRLNFLLKIYLSDARRVLPEKLRTVIRHPIKVKER